MMRNKRGVSEVIGALAMIALAVTAGIIVYVYASGIMGPLQGSKAQQPYLEQVALNFYTWQMKSQTSGNVTLMLRNTGSVQVQLADFFIAGNSMPPASVTYHCGGGSTINVNSACSISLNYSGLSFTQGDSYNVRSVTNDGAIFDFLCVAGNSATS
jgi:hypothetical protein